VQDIILYFQTDDEDELKDEHEEGLSAQDMVDFSPLYRCLHIFTVLGDKHTFENYYRKQRREQSSLVLQASTNMVRNYKVLNLIQDE
jgi:hypothetical protein